MHSEPLGRLAVVIPAYKPSTALVDVVRALGEKSFASLVVIDDGSGSEFSGTFEQVAALPRVTLLRHAVNLGKGAALRTGINHTLCTLPDPVGVVTADADGQHHPDDIEAVGVRLLAQPDSLVLGCRTFDPDVPLRSRFGNILTRGVMHALMGRKLSDTQTGLRGIPVSFALRVLKLESTGYEFETEMLIAAHQLSVPVVEEPIRTIYEQGNKSSHFNPIVDSMKIYFVLLRFGSVSLATAIVDGLIFYIAYGQSGNVLTSQILARIFALAFNYPLVRSSVFYSHQRHKSVLPKYLLLVAVSGTASYWGIQLLSGAFGINKVLAKVLAESILFCLNFAVQRLFIFKPDAPAALSTPAPAPVSGEPAPTSKLWLAVLVSLIVLAGLGIEAYGFATAHLFSQLIWLPIGLQRFTRFMAIFGGAALVVIAVAPSSFKVLAVAATAIGTAFAVGPQPLLAVVFFLISSCALGSRLLGSKHDDEPESQIFSTLLGIGVWVFVMTFLVRLPVNYTAVWITLLALPILTDLRGVGRRLVRSWEALRAPRGRAEQAACAVLVFFLLAHWFAATMPEHSADGLAMHLAIPTNIADNHRMTFEPALFVWSVMPMAADFIYAINYLLGGEFAAHLFNFAMLLVLEAMLYCVVRRWVSRTVAFLLMAMLASSPFVQLVTGSLFVENFQSAMVLGMMAAVWRFGDAGEKRYLYLIAALGGTALATKIGGLAFVTIGLPFAVREVVRHWKSLGPRPVLVSLLALFLFLGTALPAYTIAYVKTGNPLFPFFGSKIVSPLLPADAGLVDGRFKPLPVFRTLFDLTFHTGKSYEGQDGSFGFQYLVLVPLGIVAILLLRRRPATSAAVVALAAGAVLLGSQPVARYLYACLPLMTVAFAAVIGWADRPWLSRSLVVFVLAATGANAYFLPSSSYYHKEFSLRKPFSHAERDRYVKDSVPIRAVIAYYNQAHPNTAVLLVDEPSVADLKGTVFENSWHQYVTLNAIRQARNMSNMVRLMQSLKIEYFISRNAGTEPNLAPLALKEMLQRCTATEFQVGQQHLLRLQPTCLEKDPTHSAAPLTKGGYDDPDERIEYNGDWFLDRQFDRTWGHSVSYCSEKGTSFRVTFVGTAIEYVHVTASSYGIAQVLIDGKEQARMNMYSKDPAWQAIRWFKGLPRGEHTFEVRVTGEKDPLSTGAAVALDALVIEE